LDEKAKDGSFPKLLGDGICDFGALDEWLGGVFRF
jgi:hypothetical protein